MRTEPKASYRTVQYEYAYRYTPNIYKRIKNDTSYLVEVPLGLWHWLLYSYGTTACLLMSLNSWQEPE